MNETASNGLHDLAEDLATLMTEAWVAAKPEIDAAREAGGHAAAVAVVHRVLTESIEEIVNEVLPALAAAPDRNPPPVS
ncbi:MAG: hypothetical protein KIT00_10050 [Rhodospirillales bacterium]|nr:hypothetical protein [Rhodospirillales bacterium]